MNMCKVTHTKWTWGRIQWPEGLPTATQAGGLLHSVTSATRTSDLPFLTVVPLFVTVSLAQAPVK